MMDFKPDDPAELDQRTADITNVIVFLVWQERYNPNAMWGGIRIKDAVESLARRLGVPVKVMRERVLAVGDD